MRKVLFTSVQHVQNTSFSSFKSKRYREKLRGELRALEELVPVDKGALRRRRLDSQTVLRLVIAYLKTKLCLKCKYFVEL